MEIPEELLTFTLRLVEHITDEMGDQIYISEEALSEAIDIKLTEIADCIWEDYKDKIKGL